MTNQCTSKVLLREYLAGRVEEEAAERIEEHLRFCEACQEVSSRLIGEESAWARVPGSAAQGDSVYAEPELAAVLSRVQKLKLMDNTRAGKSEMPEQARPSIIRDYELLEILGEGGMGTVYRALHRRLEKTVAIKLLKADRQASAIAISRFEREMKAVGKLDHLNIVQALDAGEHKGVYFLVMDYIVGVDLGRLVQSLGPLGIADTCEVIRQAALGLQYAHANNLIHRDVKPSNLMLTKSASLKVLDLGLAQSLQPRVNADELTEDGQLVGTQRYMAPEQLLNRGPVDARSDIYSLGVTFYELLTGSIPTQEPYFDPELPELAHLCGEVPPEVRQLLGKMLAVSPKDRMTSMAQVAEILDQYEAQADLASLVRRYSGEAKAAGSRSDSTPEPPPIIASSTEARALTTEEVHRRHAIRRSRSKRRLWLTIAASLAGIFATGALIWGLATEMGSGDEEQANDLSASPAESIPTGQLTIHTNQPGLTSWITLQLQQGFLQAKNIETGEVHTLANSESSIPSGTYELTASEPNLRLIPPRFVLAPGNEITIEANVLFDFPLTYPKLPADGSFAEYAGSVAAQGVVLPYSVTLRRLGSQNVDGARCAWISVEVRTTVEDGGIEEGFTETGFFLMDEQLYEQEQLTVLKEAWISAASRSIANQLPPDVQDKRLVTRFDQDDDALIAVADRLQVEIPMRRLNVADALVLLFGADFQASSAHISQLRAILAGQSQRDLAFEQHVFPRGSVDCWVLRSNENLRDEPGPKDAALDEEEQLQVAYEIYRSEEVPFNFVDIWAKTSVIGESTLKLVNYGNFQRPRGFSTNPLEEQQEVLVRFQSSHKPFVRSSLPASKSAHVTYKGSVKRYSGEWSDFRVTVQSLGSELINGRAYRRIEIVARDKASVAYEAAQLLLDEDRYNVGEVVIFRGWLQRAGKTFELLPDNARELKPSLIDEGLLILGERELDANKLNVFEVLSLILDAPVSEPTIFSRLRPQIARAMVAADQDRIVERNREVQVFDKSYRADTWSSPAGIPDFEYKISRSRHVPFDFVRVYLKVPDKLELTAELDPGASGDAISALETPDELQQLAAATAEEIAKVRAKLGPNWRIWSDAESDRPFTWAHHAGHIGSNLNHIVLIDAHGEQFELNSATLVEDDREWLAKGRFWEKPDGTYFRGNYLWDYDSTTLFRSEGKDFEYPYSLLVDADVDWIKEFHAIRKSGTRLSVNHRQQKLPPPRAPLAPAKQVVPNRAAAPKNEGKILRAILSLFPW